MARLTYSESSELVAFMRSKRIRPHKDLFGNEFYCNQSGDKFFCGRDKNTVEKTDLTIIKPMINLPIWDSESEPFEIFWGRMESMIEARAIEDAMSSGGNTQQIGVKPSFQSTRRL